LLPSTAGQIAVVRLSYCFAPAKRFPEQTDIPKRDLLAAILLKLPRDPLPSLDFSILTLRPASKLRIHARKEGRSLVANEELLAITALNSWKLVIGRFDQTLAEWTDEQLQSRIAPDKNRLFYLVGHLTAVHDRMLPLLGLGERLHPELDEAYITNRDRLLPDPVSASDLRTAWAEVNHKLTAAFERFTPKDWLQKHDAVSADDFAKDPTRNRIAVVMSRTNHASYHSGQVVLAK
jgi:hypothetical protein